MKLLTSSGLLFAAVNSAAQTADGNMGAYPMVDWAALFTEVHLAPSTVTATAGQYNIAASNGLGLAPAVTAIMTTYDGGKLMAGYSTFDNMTTFGWVMKLWGKLGTSTRCILDANLTDTTWTIKPAGHVVMTTAPFNVYATPTCTTNTQWFWLEPSATTLAMSTASVYLAVAEDWTLGVSTVPTNAAPPTNYIGGGRSALATYGLGMYSAFLFQLTSDGIIGANDPATIDLDGYAEITHHNGFTGGNTDDNYISLTYATNGCTTALDQSMQTASTEGGVLAGGTTASLRTCLDWAIDGFNVTGIATIYEFLNAGGPTFAVVTGQSNNYAVYINTTYSTKQTQEAANYANDVLVNQGGVTQVYTDTSTTGTTHNQSWLLSGREQYCTSYLYAIKAGGNMANANVTSVEIQRALHGSALAYWYFNNIADSALLTLDLPTHIVIVGTFRGKGMYTSVSVVPGAAPVTLNNTSTSIFTDTNCGVSPFASGLCPVNAPTGGVAQFKGLTQGTEQDKYVEVICTGVQPWYGGTKWQSLSTTGGFLLTCMTGISQCQDSVDYNLAYEQLSLAERGRCLKDPRYLTWRMMTVKVAYTGAQTWYRTDSHWDQASYIVGSSWGPGIKLSTHTTSENDNNGTSDLGKTYVFALGDGSGVSINHLSYSAVAPTTNTTGGTGSNRIVSALTTFTNVYPTLYKSNWCSDTNLLLQGTTDTSSLSTAVTAFSDGYLLKSTMVLDTLYAGGLDSWRSTCLVFYSSQYVQDSNNGSVCHAVVRDSASGAGPQDFGESYLVHVPTETWQPPATSANVVPKDLALTDEKYSISYSPSAATKYLMTEGFYASAQWYQPKYASSYSLIARYGSSDWVGAFCMQGAGSSSYFSAPSTSSQLESGMALAAGAAIIVTSVIAF